MKITSGDKKLCQSILTSLVICLVLGIIILARPGEINLLNILFSTTFVSTLFSFPVAAMRPTWKGRKLKALRYTFLTMVVMVIFCEILVLLFSGCRAIFR